MRDGFLVCPACRRNKRLLRVLPETRAERVQLYCRDCKREIVVNIGGRSLEGRSH